MNPSKVISKFIYISAIISAETMVLQTSIPPRKILTYPISADDNGGAVFIYGDPKASRITILSAGFADDHDVFLPFASRLAKETGTLVGVTCLPGYDDRDDKPWTQHKRWIYV